MTHLGKTLMKRALMALVTAWEEYGLTEYRLIFAHTGGRTVMKCPEIGIFARYMDSPRMNALREQMASHEGNQRYISEHLFGIINDLLLNEGVTLDEFKHIILWFRRVYPTKAKGRLFVRGLGRIEAIMY